MTSRRTAPKSRSPSTPTASGIDPNFDIFTLPVEGGSPQNLTNLTKDNAGDDTVPLYSPDGRSLAFRRQVIKGFYADRARLMLYDRRGSKLRNLTEDWDRSADGLVWSPDCSCAVRLHRRRRHASHLSLRSRRRRAQARDSRTQLRLARDRRQRAGDRRLAPELHRTAHPREHHRAHRCGHQVVGLQRRACWRDSRPARSRASLIKAPTTKTCRCGWCIRRTSRRTASGRCYLLLHGGPHNGVTDAYQWRWNAQVFAELGLCHGLAQLPWLERLRPGVGRLHHQGMDGAAVRGHHQGHRLVPRPAVDRY